MNRCHDVESMLVRYADGDLDAAAAQRVRDHLAACDACARAVSEYRTSLEAVTSAFAGSPPQTAYRPARLRVGRVTAAFTCVLFAAAVGIGIGVSREPQDAPRVAAPVAGNTVSREEVDALMRRVAELESQLAAYEADHEAGVRAAARRRQSDEETVAAISLAAGVFLEERQGNVAEAKRRYEYAADHFADTRAGREARDRLRALDDGATPDAST